MFTSMPEGPLISPLHLLTGVGMILVAICGVWLWQRGKPSLWPVVWWGALAWVLSVGIKFAAAWPTTSLIQRHGDNPLIWVYAGLLTGVFECAVPLPLIRKTRLRRADWNGRLRSASALAAPKLFCWDWHRWPRLWRSWCRQL